MSGSRAWLRVVIVPEKGLAFVQGPGARELIEEAGGRAFWLGTKRAWSTSPAVAGDVLALAQLGRLAVAYEGPRGGGSA
ncbi:MAG: hypothetical protein Q7T56_08755 [Nocardioidaceae bacterium]|nr:hypothetical protein [Nocardioidaceae bacterium]